MEAECIELQELSSVYYENVRYYRQDRFYQNGRLTDYAARCIEFRQKDAERCALEARRILFDLIG